ncbi:hypothetical protein G6F56_000316 [Rhizopus delemar]|nr:hypothetical protein G6F56_000316 [Rhizopus delemar]
MCNRLKSRSLVDRVFVSYSCKANNCTHERDQIKQEEIIAKLQADGDTGDMLQFVNTPKKKGVHRSYRSCWFINKYRRFERLCSCQSKPLPFTNKVVIYESEKLLANSQTFKNFDLTPDGIISSLYGPVTGNRHDAQIYIQSMMEERLRPLFDLRHQRVGGCHYHIYGDVAYANSPVVQRPFSRVSANEEQLWQNRRMSSVRIAVVNEFAHVTTLFAYLDFARTLRSL